MSDIKSIQIENPPNVGSTPNEATIGVIPSSEPSSVAPAQPVPNNTSVEQPEEIDIEHFSKIKLRVARILAVEAVPKSKKLLKLQITLGDLGERQILSGIAPYYSPESLVGRKIIVVSNLKPAKIFGLESRGMLLASSSPDGEKLLLADPGDMPEGSEVR